MIFWPPVLLKQKNSILLLIKKISNSKKKPVLIKARKGHFGCAARRLSVQYQTSSPYKIKHNRIPINPTCSMLDLCYFIIIPCLKAHILRYLPYPVNLFFLKLQYLLSYVGWDCYGKTVWISCISKGFSLQKGLCYNEAFILDEIISI